VRKRIMFSRGHALIIGVGTYLNKSSFKDVPITVEDARQVDAVVRNPHYCGYPEHQVTLLHDTTASRDNILKALDELAKTSKDDTVLIFYSGHGEYGEDGYYLTTHETKVQNGKVVAGTGVHERELLEKIRGIPAKRALLIFNACHSGEISPESLGGEELSKTLPERTATALLATGEGRVIITACRETQSSWFVRGEEMTIFAQSLTDGLRGRGINSKQGYISVFDLYDYVFHSVSAEVERRWGSYNKKQEPELTIHKGIGAMAVALHRGETPQGEFNTQERPPSLGKAAVREVEPTESDKLLNQILRGEINLAAGGDINNAQVVGRDQYNKTVTISNGDYAEGDIDKRRGIFGGTFSGPAVGSVEGGTVTIGASPVNRTESVISLQDILNQVHRVIAQAKEQGENKLANEAEDVVRNLEAAINAQNQGDSTRRQKYLNRAKEDIKEMGERWGSSQELLRMIEQVQ
jgi:hypothetical protein